MAGPGWAAVWTLIAGVSVTIVGAAATLFVSRRNDRLKAQLDFVNMQLRYFYGPLLANAEASERAWAAFKRRHNATGIEFWDPDNRPTAADITAWHHWITTVFMPLHERSMEVISERADLLIGNGLPQCLADLVAHILALKAVLALWKDDPHYIPQIPPYPSKALNRYLEQSFGALKRDQFMLLKTITATSEHPLVDNSADISLISDKWRSP
jgi:hypothetical protein